MTDIPEFQLLRFFSPSGRTPGFVIPVFSNGTNLYIQDGEIEGNVTRFVPIDDDLPTCHVDDVTVFGSASRYQRVGEQTLVAFQLNDAEVVCGTAADLQDYLRRQVSLLESYPFLLAEVAEFLDEEHLRVKAAETTTRTLESENRDIAEQWQSEHAPRPVWSLLADFDIRAIFADDGDRDSAKREIDEEFRASSKQIVQTIIGNRVDATIIARDGRWLVAQVCER